MCGIHVIFTPCYILLVDCLSEHWAGDYFLLYNSFRDTENLGYVGILLTILIGFIIMSIGFGLNLLYLLNLHMNGRMMDIYRRLHAEESDLFIPQDLEISPRILHYINKKSKQWKGSHGTTRKVLCTAYTVRDHRDPNYLDRMIHYSIYNVTPKQGKKPEQRELYRHFVRDSTGAIIEAFDSVESLGAENMKQIEEQMLYDTAMKSNEEGEREEEIRMLAIMENEKRAKDKRDADDAAGRIKLALTRKSGKENYINNDEPENDDRFYGDEKDYDDHHENDQEHEDHEYQEQNPIDPSNNNHLYGHMESSDYQGNNPVGQDYSSQFNESKRKSFMNYDEKEHLNNPEMIEEGEEEDQFGDETGGGMRQRRME